RIELVGEVTIIGPWVRVRCPITPGDNEGEGIQEFCLPQAHIIGILATPHPRDGADPGSVHTEQAPVTESSRDPDTGEPLSDDAFDEYLWAILDQAPGRDRRPSMAISPAETEVIARLLDDLVDHHGTAPIGGTAREMAARLRSRLPKK
ncbi:MAG: hypothetical protein Q4F67_14735, partial [Propionibacteriaceae bacterium]|nr:hypothetical protein [Propionibacteriaceae bacterium]